MPASAVHIMSKSSQRMEREQEHGKSLMYPCRRRHNLRKHCQLFTKYATPFYVPAIHSLVRARRILIE